MSLIHTNPGHEDWVITYLLTEILTDSDASLPLQEIANPLITALIKNFYNSGADDDKAMQRVTDSLCMQLLHAHYFTALYSCITGTG